MTVWNKGYCAKIGDDYSKIIHKLDPTVDGLTVCGKSSTFLATNLSMMYGSEACKECDVILEEVWPEIQWIYNPTGLAKYIEIGSDLVHRSN